MKHINITSWKGSITDWTELNYIKGGLPDEYANIANIKGNYLRKSKNLIALNDIAETTINGITYKIENGAITLGGLATASTRLFFALNIEIKENVDYTYNQFNKVTGYGVYLAPSNSQSGNQQLL